MKPQITLCALLACASLHAQQADPNSSEDISDSSDEPAAIPPESASPTALATKISTGPRLLDPIPDGSPPPPPPPSKIIPFVHARGHLLDAKIIRQGGRNITYQRVTPLPVPPPPEPAAPPTAEERAAISAHIAALRKDSPKHDFLLIGATVYLSKNHLPRTFIRHWPTSGGEPVSLWTNLDLRQHGIHRFLGSDGTIHELLMMWSIMNIDQLTATWPGKKHTYKPPVFPDFPNETVASAGNPAALVGPATYSIAPHSPTNPELTQTFADFLQLCNENQPALAAAFLKREAARAAREAELKAHPPQPQDITVHYWLNTTAPILSPETPGFPAPTDTSSKEGGAK